MNRPIITASLHPVFRWDDIDTVLLDMDGTLLDKYFDDYFWEKHLPAEFAKKHALSKKKAEEMLLAKYRSVEDTLQWTDLNYWTDRLGLDIASLKKGLDHLIQVHDGVTDFLKQLRIMKKRVFLVTNAHPKALEIKLNKTNIGAEFDRIICSEEVGEAKEQVRFWHLLENHLDFNKEKTLFADDTEKVLLSAHKYGISHLIHIAKPSSRLPVKYSENFPSIITFRELLES